MKQGGSGCPVFFCGVCLDGGVIAVCLSGMTRLFFDNGRLLQKDRHNMSFPGAFAGNPLLWIQPVMDSRQRGNDGFLGLIRHVARGSTV